MAKSETIFALSTILGKSGVAVVRISGPHADKALENLGVELPVTPRKAILTKIYHRQEVLDECLAIFFRAPHSFTGEDIVELHLHGSIAIVNDVMEALSEFGFLRMAEPGDFSKRAFLNSKMDLTEAEGLADLIDAETSVQRKIALRQYGGELLGLYEKWRQALLHLLARLEALIDFPDEDIPESLITNIDRSTAKLAAEIERHLYSAQAGFAINRGIQVAIVGPTNAGKSSLLNALSRQEAAIVSENAGTTRDVIKVKMDIAGYPVILADTAGLRDLPGNTIEAEGIKRARRQIENADILLLVLDITEIDNIALINDLKDAGKRLIIILNKYDLQKRQVNEDEIIKIFPDNNLPKIIYTSVKEGYNIATLIDWLRSIIGEQYSVTAEPTLTKVRYKMKLEEALGRLQAFDISMPLEIAAEDLRASISAIASITGKVEVEDILDVIFSTFCIGK